MANKIQLRNDTAANWTSVNPTLAQGEFGWESDTGKWKIGNGSAAWTALAYRTSMTSAEITTVLGYTPANAADLTAKQALVNAAVALTDAATIDLTAIKHTLASSAAARTFTISYTGDDITLVVTLSATSATYTFPATALCVSEGTASGDNLLALSGVSGDKYVIGIKKVGSAYYVASKNFGQ